MSDLGVVAIGRNEGERLRRSLNSLVGRGLTIVYVDSGSTDGSTATARSMGVEVVDLDMSMPFSASRGRNAGFERLSEIAPHVRFVMFLDGDCEVAEGWLDRGVRELEARPDAAIVCGVRREKSPERSIYNRLADLEWSQTPPGEVQACGGDAMIRAEAFRQVGGYDPTAPAGEEPELCHRLRLAGWKIWLFDVDMTWHDIDITRFRQWWRRNYRAGYSGLHIATRFARPGGDDLFRSMNRSVRIWTLGWLLAMVVAIAVGAIVGGPFWALGFGVVMAMAPVLQACRIAYKIRRKADSPRTAIAHGVLTMVGKWAMLAGQIGYLRDRSRGRRAPLVEYKLSESPSNLAAPVGRETP